MKERKKARAPKRKREDGHSVQGKYARVRGEREILRVPRRARERRGRNVREIYKGSKRRIKYGRQRAHAKTRAREERMREPGEREREIKGSSLLSQEGTRADDDDVNSRLYFAF